MIRNNDGNIAVRSHRRLVYIHLQYLPTTAIRAVRPWSNRPGNEFSTFPRLSNRSVLIANRFVYVFVR